MQNWGIGLYKYFLNNLLYIKVLCLLLHIFYNDSRTYKVYVSFFSRLYSSIRFHTLSFYGCPSAIIRKEYAENIQTSLNRFFGTENQYSKRDGSLRRIMNAHTQVNMWLHVEVMTIGLIHWNCRNRWISWRKIRNIVCVLWCKYYRWNRENVFINYSLIDDRDYTGDELFKSWIIIILYRHNVLDYKTDK